MVERRRCVRHGGLGHRFTTAAKGTCTVPQSARPIGENVSLFSAQFVQEERSSPNDSEGRSDKADFAAGVEHIKLPVDDLINGHSLIRKPVHAEVGPEEMAEIKLTCDGQQDRNDRSGHASQPNFFEESREHLAFVCARPTQCSRRMTTSPFWILTQQVRRYLSGSLFH